MAEATFVRNGGNQEIHVQSNLTLVGDVHVTQVVQQDCPDLSRIRKDISVKLKASYNNIPLPRVPWVKNLDLNLDDLYVNGILTEIKKVNRQIEENPIKLEELFIEENCLCIYIEGGPGYGKTTIGYKLGSDWIRVDKEYLSKFDLVFVIQLRYLTTSIDNVLAMMAQVDNHPKDVILKAIEDNAKGILLVLDGYDELAEENRHFVMPILMRSRLPQATVVVTSREGKFLHAKDCFWQKKVCLRGITKAEQKKFLEYYLEDTEKAERVVLEISRLTHRNMETLFNCPLFLILLAFVINEDESGAIDLPKNKTQLYKCIFNFIVRNSLNRERINTNRIVLFNDVSCGEQTDIDHNDHNEEAEYYLNLLKNFGELALISLTELRFSFTKEEILQYCNDENILNLGFLRTGITHRQRIPVVYYEVIHTSFLEFLAALYLQNASEEDLEKVFVKFFYRWDSTLIFNFLVGLMGENCHKFFKICCNYTHGSIHFPFYLDLLYEINDNDLTNIPYSMAKYLPSKWQISWERHKNGFSKKSIHSEMINQGINSGAINSIHYKELYIAELPFQIVYPTIIVNVGMICGIESSEENVRKLKELKCNNLVLCNVKDTNPCIEIGKLFLNNVKADNIYLKVDNCKKILCCVKKMAHCIDKVKWLNVNKLVVAEKWDVICDIVEHQVTNLKMTVNNIINWKALPKSLNYFDVTLDSNCNNDETVNLLVSIMSDMPTLDEIALTLKGDYMPIINIDILCKNGNKPLQKVKLKNVKLSVTKPVVINHLVIDNVELLDSVNSLMNCSIESLQCSSTILQQINYFSRFDNCFTQNLQYLSVHQESSEGTVLPNNAFSNLKQLRLNLTDDISDPEKYFEFVRLSDIKQNNTMIFISISIGNSLNTDLTLTSLLNRLKSHSYFHRVNLIIKFTVLFQEVDQEQETFNLLKQSLLEKKLNEIHFKIAPHRNTPGSIGILYKTFLDESIEIRFLKTCEDAVQQALEYAFLEADSTDDTWVFSLK